MCTMTNIYERFRNLGQDTLDWLYAIGLTVLTWLILVFGPALLDQGRPLSRSAANLVGPHMYVMPIAYVIAALAFLPLAYRRHFPLSVLVTATIGAVLASLTKSPLMIVEAAPLLAVYTLGTVRGKGVLIVGAIGSAALLTLASTPGLADNRFWLHVLSTFALFGAAAAMGLSVGSQRAYVAEVEARAAEAARIHEEEAHRRVDEERLRIARELHDVTAHSLSIIAVQSGVAAHVLNSNPAEARRALDAIRRTSKSALDELRAMLRVMRSADESGVPLTPVPSLARIDELIAPLIDAGFSVQTDLGGDLTSITSVVDFSAYRIIQEALTNVVRHAGVCGVRLTVRRDADGLTIEITDDGRSPAAGSIIEGHGLAGMRERVSALGGSFEAGPYAERGFRVMAHLPLSEVGAHE